MEKKDIVERPLLQELADEAEGSIHTSVRSRKMAVKGLEYSRQTKFQRLEKLCKALERQVDRLLDMFGEETKEYKAKIQDLYKKWVLLYDEFLTVDQDYRKLLTQRRSKLTRKNGLLQEREPSQISRRRHLSGSTQNQKAKLKSQRKKETKMIFQ